MISPETEYDGCQLWLWGAVVLLIAFGLFLDQRAGLPRPPFRQMPALSVVTRLEGRRGVFETPYHGPIYVLDVATNNPAAADGALSASVVRSQVATRFEESSEATTC